MNRLLLISVLTMLLCSSCASKNTSATHSPASLEPPVAASVGVPHRLVQPTAKPRPNPEPVIISLSQNEYAEAAQKGEQLLKEYRVQAGQTIRFPSGEHIFDAHGDVPVTSIATAQKEYPNWPIPKALGSYVFKDLTLYRERTSVVFPNTVPAPKAEIAVREDGEPHQYYLCYENALGRFIINVLPATEDVPLTELRSIFDDPDYLKLPSCPGAFFYPISEEDQSLFTDMHMTVESGRGYAFMIRKLAGGDCLDSESAPFSEKEAKAIYTGIQKEFSR